ncbi:MAG: SWIM zinc finger family protein [Conexivisphaerales archaeon]|jgi:predicted nucleic acid-binding Zn finger protein
MMSRPADDDDSYHAKASKIVDSGGVKRHIFEPSGTEIWTVVGAEGEYLVSDDPPLCTCPAFYFSLTRGKKRNCHHLIAVELAKQEDHVATTVGRDEEIRIFLKLLCEEASEDDSSQLNE